MFPWIRHLSLLPKITRRARGGILRLLIRLSGGACGPALSVEGGFRLRHGCHKGLQFGRGIYIGRNTTIDCPPGARLRLADDVTLTQGVFIGLNVEITIGRDALIGEYCTLRDSNHRFDGRNKPIRTQGSLSKPVAIGDDCWIGRGSCILPGASLGQGVIVGANAVVNKPMPAYAIVAGSPARVIKSRFSHEA